jgi:D-inositol-3-phosphate glycosyltransferase
LEVSPLRIAMLSVHSCPVGELGTKDTGGMSVHIRELAREMGSRGHFVDIYTRSHGSSCSRVVDLSTNVRLLHLGAGDGKGVNKTGLFPYLEDFFRELEASRSSEALRYDLVHSHYWLSGRVGRWAQERWRIPHLLMFHTLGAVKNALFHRQLEPELRTTTEKQLAAQCDRILAASEREKEHLVRFCGVPHEAVGVVPCGVDLDRFRPIGKARAREKLGLDPDESVLLYVGRFAALKGIDRLLEATAYLKRNRDLRLMIVGGDVEQTPESQELKNLSRRFGIQDLVTFTGRVDHEKMPLYYSAADVLALPSHYESFGLVALESLACGTPVVTTQVGAMEKIIRQDETGRVVQDASPPALAEAVEAFLPGSKTLSVEAIRASVLVWSWSSAASAMIDEYVLLLGKKRQEIIGDLPEGVPASRTDTLI